jgi:hypothetical protein
VTITAVKMGCFLTNSEAAVLVLSTAFSIAALIVALLLLWGAATMPSRMRFASP